MVSLLCFSCDHRNPIGSRFCNACGTPMNFRPCKHCGAINVRAAAHCHQCGETFDLAFLAEPEAEAEAAGIAPQQDITSTLAASAAFSGNGIAWKRAVPLTIAVAACATLLVALAPSPPRSASIVSGQVLDRESAADAASGPAVTPALSSTPPVLVPVAAPVAESPVPLPAPPEPALATVQRDLPEAKADIGPPAASKAVRREPPRRTTGSTQRGGQSSTTAARRDTRPSDRAAVATGSRNTSTSARRPALHARADVASASPRLCAEGTMPEPGCDVRLPKGN